ncbi:MAG: hypothetical protein DI586_08750 [Micavibrio aeruginosavorus]|uniref:Uncharacterized protein n=1 Tax=Micavibrio aeruginosavorus TaxID=349221 RepID=A0A2W5HGT2_9BACT|nr:MAG: hypothetical protein DI586_08750 [Micavibrio aeruginosavorus]
MMQMISGKDLARLYLDLQVPSMLGLILSKDQDLCSSDDCKLRRAFQELSPLESLISIACCFHVLVPHLHHERDLIEPFLTHADYILDDYAPHWMRQSLPATNEWNNFIRDDLELTADLLTLLSDAALGVHPAIEEICDILNEQAFLKSLSPTPLPANITNVIRFPIERRV